MLRDDLGWRGVLAEHEAAWASRWQCSDVEVDGDAAAQQALRFAIYHLNSAANPADERVSIGARALTGDDYHGHVFWDTEIFLLPFYILTWPEAARALLMYRFRTLDAARAKSARMGWRGALYAWESADTGAETTPEQVIGPDRQVIDILSGKEEQHISADVRNSQEAGTVIDQFFEHGRIELLFAHQIDQNARIEIATARAHDHPAGWGQSHAGVDRFSAFDRGDACTIAEMGNDQAVRQIVRKLMHDRFAGKAVKSVALDTLRLQFLGNWKHTRDIGQFGVKGGVETCRLRKSRKMLLRKADNRQSRWGMQRRKGGRRFELPQDQFVNQAMLPELRSAMHNTMPDRGWCRHFGVVEKPSDADDRFPLAGNGCCLGRATRFRASLRTEIAAFIADRLRFAGEQLSVREGPTRYKAEFERGGAAVQREYDQLWFSVCHAHLRRNIVLTRSSASRGPPACRRHAR